MSYAAGGKWRLKDVKVINTSTRHFLFITSKDCNLENASPKSSEAMNILISG